MYFRMSDSSPSTFTISHELCEVIPALREEQFREKKPKMEMFYTGSTLYSKEAIAISISISISAGILYGCVWK